MGHCCCYPSPAVGIAAADDDVVVVVVGGGAGRKVVGSWRGAGAGAAASVGGVGPRWVPFLGHIRRRGGCLAARGRHRLCVYVHANM